MLNVTFPDYIMAMLFSRLLFYRGEFLNAKKVFKNWLESILFRFGILARFIGKPRKGGSVEIENLWEYYRLLYTQMLEDAKIWGAIIKFKYNDKKLRFYSSTDKMGLLDSLGVLGETFGMEVYKRLDVKDKIIVDIGSYIGDSPIYFILNGARRVYALEPYPSSYILLLKNIKVNGLDEKIIALNEGLSEKIKEIRIREDHRALATSRLKDFHEGKPVRLTNLEEIVEKFNLENACLKIDCEGCEYSILKAPDNILGAFQEMMIEYHYGYMNLKERLRKAGFKVENTRPILHELGNQKLFMGYIHAKRKTPI